MRAREIFKAIGKKLRHPAVGCVVICMLVAIAVLAVRRFGWLQRPEFMVYDHLVRQFSDPNSTDDRIVIVGMTEDDLRDYGFPISDRKLAQLLEKISAQKPVVIGLDLYRDYPEPRNGDELKELEKVFAAHEEIVAIERVGFVHAPNFFRDEKVAERLSANNLPKDFFVDGVYRRAPLFVNVSPDVAMPSFSLVLAFKYLEANRVDYKFDEVFSEELGEKIQLLTLGKTQIPRLENNSGPYVGATFEDKYGYLANFQSPRKHRKQPPPDKDSQAGRDTPHDYSFGEVLTDKVPEGALAGKIVLVATVMQSVKDSNPTPIHENLRGVQYHAMLVHQILEAGLNGKPFRTWWTDRQESLWIAGCTVLGGMLGLWLRSPWKLVPGLALALFGIGAVVWYAFAKGTVLLLVAPAVGCFLATALVTSYVVALERSDRRAVQSLLSKHVSKKVAAFIFEHRDQFLDGGKMAPKGCTGTVIFTDLAGFSTASEKLSPQQVMKWLNAYMEVMTEIVERYEGTVNKFIGDAIMGTFGAPIVHEDEEGINADAANAIRCGLHMRRQIPILNSQWRANEPDMPSVAMRIGIFTGPLVSGSFGSAERMEWTVIGDSVNRANRLEAAGKEIKDQLTEEEKLCSILIGPETYARVGQLFETVPVSDMALKGITERVTVYRVLSERAPT